MYETIRFRESHIEVRDYLSNTTIYIGKWDDMEEDFVKENFERRIFALWGRGEMDFTDWEPSLVVEVN